MDKQDKKQYLFPIAIFLIAFLYSSFFLQGIRLFDNDYNQWLTYAMENSLSNAIWDVFNPVLNDWNVDYRPTQTLIFKALFFLFDYNASGYYYFKSLMLALFSTAYFLFLRHYLNNLTVAAFSALFLAMASSTFTSLMWVSDFVIVSEFLALLVYTIFLNLETRETSSRKLLFTSLVIMIILTVICDRTKANGKLIPGILFLYLVLFDWRKLKRYWIAISLMVFAVVPWKVLVSNPAPFFLRDDSGTVRDYAWQLASFYKFLELFGGDFEPFSLLYSAHPPISVLAIIGFPLLFASIIAMFFLVYRRAINLKHKTVRFLAVWGAVNAAALMSYPSLPSHFQARYAISTLIPLVPLLLIMIFRASIITWGGRRIPEIIIAALIIISICFHGYHTFMARNIFPPTMIASDTLREYVANNFRNTWFYYINSSVWAFRPTNDGNQFFSYQNEKASSVASRLPPNTDFYVISSRPLETSSLKLHMSFPGKSESLFDRIFNNGSAPFYKTTFYLYKIESD
ncbi:MAG: hypothetical protein HZB80_07605 [Deltaproteobacteria bacterium]|nr:hypothetical protein [Deltaproteobacteria bacterium]